MTPSVSSAKKSVAAVVTVSDSCFKGERTDTSGPALARILQEAGFEVKRRETVPDEKHLIASKLISLAEVVDLIVTTGGTGLGARDVTPEATRDVIDKEVLGFAEVIRQVFFAKTPTAVLSRATAGIRRRCLIVNLPGSEKGATESLALILPALPHALEVLQHDSVECGRHLK